MGRELPMCITTTEERRLERRPSEGKEERRRTEPNLVTKTVCATLET